MSPKQKPEDAVGPLGLNGAPELKGVVTCKHKTHTPKIFPKNILCKNIIVISCAMYMYQKIRVTLAQCMLSATMAIYVACTIVSMLVACTMGSKYVACTIVSMYVAYCNMHSFAAEKQTPRTRGTSHFSIDKRCKLSISHENIMVA